jgi:hypothetical protein
MLFLESIRKILNETRQDRVCRPFLAKRSQVEILPFLGSLTPAYCFLGVNPTGYDVSDVPTQAEEYLEYATSYFGAENNDKASFAAYLPYASNHSGDFAEFGQAACVTHLVPILTQRSSEVNAALVRACWPRTRKFLEVLKPSLVLVHGALAWKFLTGQEEESAVITAPGTHMQGVPELYAALEAEKIPFQSKWAEMPDDYQPWIVPLPHMGGTGGGKELRKKGEAAVIQARRRLSGGTTSSRIRVRKP